MAPKNRSAHAVPRRADRLLGHPSEAWYGQDFWSAHIHSDDRESALSFCLEQSRRATDYDFQYRMVAKDGRIIFINAQTARLFGHSSRELIGKRIETLMPERFRRSHVGHRAGYASARQVRTMGSALALFGLRKDGSEFPVEISLSPLTLDGETLVVSAIRDVTERRRAVAEIVELKSRYEDLYENAPDIYLSTAADTAKLIQCNETAVRTLG